MSATKTTGEKDITMTEYTTDYHPTWTPNAPIVHSSGEVTVKLVAKRLSDSTTTDYQAADAIARRLVTNARLNTRWTTPINGEHVRTYIGDGLVEA